jgi:endonuclease IV
MKNDKDNMWTVEREPDDKRKTRGIDTLNWLWKRKETEIALVAHATFFLNMMNKNEDVQIDENLGKVFS